MSQELREVLRLLLWSVLLIVTLAVCWRCWTYIYLYDIPGKHGEPLPRDWRNPPPRSPK
jgi:TRAP-type C4-dicarboxylate transport system permease small subunit